MPIIRWEDIISPNVGLDPAPLLSWDNMHGIAAWLRTAIRERELDASRHRAARAAERVAETARLSVERLADQDKGAGLIVS